MRVRIGTILLTVVWAVALCAAASAEVDPYYSGPVDTATGEAVDAAESNRVLISGSTYYDREERVFVYATGQGITEVRSTAADGMIVSEPVSVRADDSVDLVVNRNGTELEGQDYSVLNQAGSYTVSLRGGETAVNLFSFTIVGPQANLSGGYVMPEGFYILDATLNGEETYYERNYIGMEEEGLYEVEYVCPATGAHYTLSTTVDRTPPQLTLDGRMDKNGRYHSAVQIGGLEAGDTVSITRDGNAVSLPADMRLTEAGVYQLQAFDPAGNSAAAQFTILVYLDLNSLLFFALVCLSAAGVLTYILIKRKKLKII